MQEMNHCQHRPGCFRECARAMQKMSHVGNHRVHTNSWQDGNSHWHDSHASLVYPLAASKQFYARCWNSCWSNWNTGAYHSQFFAMCKDLDIAVLRLFYGSSGTRITYLLALALVALHDVQMCSAHRRPSNPAHPGTV